MAILGHFWVHQGWTHPPAFGSFQLETGEVKLACFCFVQLIFPFSVHASRMQAPNSGRRCYQLLGPKVESGQNGLAQSAELIHIGQENRRMKAIVSRSAIIATSLLTGLIVFSATPSIADNARKQETKQNQVETLGKVESVDSTAATRATVDEPKPVVAASPYVATAYSLRGRTASGRMVSRGVIAADPSILPLGSRVRLDHPGYSGEYIVADTGGAIRGRRIDIWTPSTGEAMRFGRRTVKLTVLSYGARKTRRTAKG
jgi:3D (Asp-Asp-Asp) domain-containing protein